MVLFCIFRSLIRKDFNEQYLESLSIRMQNHILDFRKLYTDLYNELSEYSDSSVDNIVVKGLGKVSKSLGDVISTVPLINKTLIDESLIDVGDKMVNHQSSKVSHSFDDLVSIQTNSVQPFVNNLNLIRELFNPKINYYIDNNYLYYTEELIIN